MRYSKFRNRTTEIDGIKFHSKKEAFRYSELKALQMSGQISGLELQPSFKIAEAVIFNGKKIRAKFYKADFKYRRFDGVVIVEDVKGYKTQVYMLKRSLFISLYPQYLFMET